MPPEPGCEPFDPIAEDARPLRRALRVGVVTFALTGTATWALAMPLAGHFERWAWETGVHPLLLLFAPPTLAAVFRGTAAWGRAVARCSRPAGHCPACGYDLRATPSRCPECGHVPSRPVGI